MINPSVKSSFDTLLKLQEVILHTKIIAALADIGTEIPSGEEQTGLRYGATGQVVLRREQ